MLLALAFAPFSIIRDAEAPLRYRILVVWLLLCLIALSPLRYVFFQLVLAASFPVQTRGACAASLCNRGCTPDMGMSLWGESPLWEDPMSSG